jgi:hypothetical protein
MRPKLFVPRDFIVKEEVKTSEFVLLKLNVDFLQDDYEAVMSSIEIIKKTRGGDEWPFPEMTLEQDRSDLYWHQTEFALRCSFAYSIYSTDNSICLGCLYIFPPEKPWLEYPEGTDAVVNFWVTTNAYEKGLYDEVYRFMVKWIADEWPFKKVFYSNVEIPKEFQKS